ncbi:MULTISPECIES: hypothetical protein [Shewanella]|uniref:Cold shock domain-containing protein n=1 Tax=Shewanella marisflavi TaxID=260364 RepID=A0ABX5WIP7_9GAMM|nr:MULTISPECIES: hypothetical protein [Shewanella]QDF74372.1 hypothetical protein FGA12_03860 [Shewanella marisflavi]
MDIRAKRGTLVRWNQEQRVGFIAPEDGSDELRIFGINLLPYEHMPKEGEPVVYRQWKDTLRGTKVTKAEIDLGNPITLTSPFESHDKFANDDAISWRVKVALVALAIAFGNLLYLFMINYDVSGEVDIKPPEGLFPPGSEYYVGKQDLSDVVFSCDARQQCLQMTSCQEAKYFVQNCPGFQSKVGDMPCETLWCKPE